MQTNEFEARFADFLETRDYDKAASDLFAIVRIAFAAGWQAAGGQGPVPQKIFSILPQNRPAAE